MRENRIADVLRAEIAGVDLQKQEGSPRLSVLAMRKDGSLYEIGSVAFDALYQDPEFARRAISEIKFPEP